MRRSEGQRIHRMIAELAATCPDLNETITRVTDMFDADPCGGTTQRSSRLRCVTAVSVYLGRCRPTSGWKLDGVEVDVGAAVVDLVWVDGDGRVVFDEIKSGRVDIDRSPRVRDQLARLAVGGRNRHPGSFVGVRLVPLATPGRMRTLDTTSNGELVVVDTPAGMELR